SRERCVCNARSVIVTLARRRTNLSYPEIATALKLGSHTTCIAAEQRAFTDTRTYLVHGREISLSQAVAQIDAELKSGPSVTTPPLGVIEQMREATRSIVIRAHPDGRLLWGEHDLDGVRYRVLELNLISQTRALWNEIIEHWRNRTA